MPTISVYELAQEAARSRRENRETNPRPAVQRVLAKYAIPISREDGSVYRKVLSLLGKRGGDKSARMRIMRTLQAEDESDTTPFPTTLITGVEPKPVPRDRLGRRIHKHRPCVAKWYE